MSLNVPKTINRTSFAVGFMDASVLVLDALSLTGEARRTKFTQALGRLDTAYSYAAGREDLILAQGLTATIRKYESEGMTW